MRKELTLKEVARQLCDSLEMDIDKVTKKLENYLINNPMPLNELNEKCWKDSATMFDNIMQ